MSVTAQQLGRSGGRGRDLDGVVREQLILIDERLHAADRTWGWNVVVYDLPHSFMIMGLPRRDAQRIVYSSIIKSLWDRGFVVKIILQDRPVEKFALYIGWVADVSAAEVMAMNKLIRMARIEAEGVADFLSNPPDLPRGAPPPREGPSRETGRGTGRGESGAGSHPGRAGPAEDG